MTNDELMFKCPNAPLTIRSFEHSVINSSFVIRISSLILLLAGCASTPPPRPSPPDVRANLSLDQISNRPALPTTAPSDAVPPVAALGFYAQGIDHLLDHRPMDAIMVLQRALRIDPDSYEAYWALGEAEFDRAGAANQRSIDAFEHAAVLRPDDLDAQLLLARQCMVTDNHPKALEHLRLAMQTSQYATDSADAASVDLLLARLLQQDGYTRAALDEFLQLQQRLADPTEEMRDDQDLGYLVASPQWLQLRIAQLCDDLGHYQQALDAYRPLVENDPANFQLQAEAIQILSELGRDDQAVRQAADLAQRFDAAPQSVALLERVSLAGGYDRAVDRLKALQHQLPENRAVIVALADLWDAHGRADDARHLLENAAAQFPADDTILLRLCDFYADHGDPLAGPRVLIEQLAAHPDLLWRIEPVFETLVRPMRPHALRPAQLEQIEVPMPAQAARLYLLSRAAVVWHRDALARASIESAVKLHPPFAPAYFAALDQTALDPDLNEADRDSAETALIAQAASSDPALAAELQCRLLCLQKKFAQAAKLDGFSDTAGQMVYAAALDGLHQAVRYRQVLRGLTTQYPRYTPAWEALHDSFARAGQWNEGASVLTQWLAVDPANPSARLYEAQWDFRQGQTQLADDRIARVLQDFPDDPDVLANAQSIYAQLDRSDVFISRLQELHEHDPGNLTLAETMIDAMANTHPVEAAQVLDQARAAVGADPALLYQLALLYHEIGRDRVYKQLLAQVVQADANNAPANNDLGYCWADAGTNLNHAEQLIRAAVAAEPDNQAFLDSLGWVLYKQGRFAEAARWFQQAIAPPELPDPEILDHFGDDLYRMGRRTDAAAQWQRSLEQLRIRPVEDQTELRLHVQRKLEDARLGQPVNVAPVVSGDVDPAAHRNQ
jgi:Tfp pilus assembly protein PilF